MAGRPYSWIIDTGSAIGNIGFRFWQQRSVVRSSGHMWIGIFDRSQISKGLGTEAIKLLLDFVFGRLGLHRMMLNVLAFNTRAIRAYKKCGFVQEGCHRNSVWIDGKFHDEFTMAVLEHEYAAAPDNVRRCVLAQNQKTKEWELIRLPSKRTAATFKRKADVLRPAALIGKVRLPITVTVLKANGDYQREIALR
jgi:hypothetical protein